MKFLIGIFTFFLLVLIIFFKKGVIRSRRGYYLFIIILLCDGLCLRSLYADKCRNKKYLDCLDNQKLNFILCDDYYELPCSISEFLDNGWTVVNEFEKKPIPPGKTQSLHLEKKGFFIMCILINESDVDIGVTEGKAKAFAIQIVSAFYNNPISRLLNTKANKIIIKEGINMKTSANLVKRISEKSNDYNLQFIYDEDYSSVPIEATLELKNTGMYYIRFAVPFVRTNDIYIKAYLQTH